MVLFKHAYRVWRNHLRFSATDSGTQMLSTDLHQPYSCRHYRPILLLLIILGINSKSKSPTEKCDSINMDEVLDDSSAVLYASLHQRGDMIESVI